MGGRGEKPRVVGRDLQVFELKNAFRSLQTLFVHLEARHHPKARDHGRTRIGGTPLRLGHIRIRFERFRDVEPFDRNAFVKRDVARQFEVLQLPARGNQLLEKRNLVVGDEVGRRLVGLIKGEVLAERRFRALFVARVGAQDRSELPAEVDPGKNLHALFDHAARFVDATRVHEGPGPTGVAARPLVRSGSGIHQLERFQHGAVVVEAREDARAAKCEFRIGVRLFEREAPRLDTLLHDGIEVLEHRLRIVGEVLEVTEVVVGQNHEGLLRERGRRGARRDCLERAL